MGSNMHLKYVHYFGNESNESILEAYGLKTKSEEIDRMKQVPCPNCAEPNKIDSKFCVKCRMILSYDTYLESVEEHNELTDTESSLKQMQNQIDEIYAKIKANEKQEIEYQIIE